MPYMSVFLAFWPLSCTIVFKCLLELWISKSLLLFSTITFCGLGKRSCASLNSSHLPCLLPSMMCSILKQGETPDHCWLLPRKLGVSVHWKHGFPLGSKSTADVGKALVLSLPTLYSTTDRRNRITWQPCGKCNPCYYYHFWSAPSI